MIPRTTHAPSDWDFPIPARGIARFDSVCKRYPAFLKSLWLGKYALRQVLDRWPRNTTLCPHMGGGGVPTWSHWSSNQSNRALRPKKPTHRPRPTTRLHCPKNPRPRCANPKDGLPNCPWEAKRLRFRTVAPFVDQSCRDQNQHRSSKRDRCGTTPILKWITARRCFRKAGAQPAILGCGC